MHRSAHATCVGKDGTGQVRRAKIVRVMRVENMRLWKECWPGPHLVHTHTVHLPLRVGALLSWCTVCVAQVLAPQAGDVRLAPRAPNQGAAAPPAR